MSSQSNEQMHEELKRWEKHHIDVESLVEKVGDVEKENDALRDKVLLLERRIQVSLQCELSKRVT